MTGSLKAIALAIYVSAFWSSIRADGAEDPGQSAKTFRAGAAIIDIAPPRFPVLVNGGFLQNQATKLQDPINARGLVLDDGKSRLAIVVVDSCMMTRELLDRAKAVARDRVGIPSDRVLISATHTHSAPAAMSALGSSADESYAAILPGRIADCIEKAVKNLEPAKIGWSAIDDDHHTYCRRFIRRPDKLLDDPFGRRNVRANMHPGYENPDVIGPAGPVDPALTLLAVQSNAGRPIAVLANYSMHYFGTFPVSADYFGRFTSDFANRIGADHLEPAFVAMMSQGTSGDQMWMDYSRPKNDPGLDVYAREVAQSAFHAYERITFHDWVSLDMAETELRLDRRVPDDARLKWARQIVARMGERQVPRDLAEVYAREAIYLHDEPRRSLKLQAIRVGELGITAIPSEVFAISGLKVKLQSPFDLTMNIELANGSEGYIPPPEQHAIGGYTTWPARTAALEVQAEPRIVDALLALLEKVSGKNRRVIGPTGGRYSAAVLASKPLAYWRLDDIQGTRARDAAPGGHHAGFNGGVAFFLPGASGAGMSSGSSINRAVHLAGGRLETGPIHVGPPFSVELWFWNGLSNDIRPFSAYLVSRAGTAGDQLAISGTQTAKGGTQTPKGRLIFASDLRTQHSIAGKTTITPRSWHHVVLVREPRRVTVYLDGNPELEIRFERAAVTDIGPMSLNIGSAQDGTNGLEGKVDEVAIYSRALTAVEAISHYRAATAR